jgi:hypothetical protein
MCRRGLAQKGNDHEHGNHDERTETEVKAAKKTKAAKTTKQAGRAAKGPKAKSAKTKDSKKELVLGLLRRKEGATIAEITKATNWQNHSIRGFISGTLTKKMGLSVESTKNDGGERTYRIE